jgi:hypothetical protein
MLQASHIIVYGLAAIYCVTGVLVLRRAFKPSCRVCLHRQSCPNREGNHPSEAAKSACMGDASSEESRHGAAAKAGT